MNNTPLRILVVDDSRLFRAAITEALATCPDVQVVGSVFSGQQALDHCRQSLPDLITLDLHMPGLSGLETLRSLRDGTPAGTSGTFASPGLPGEGSGGPYRPRGLPGVLVVSTLTQAGADITLQALQEGAFDFIQKPDSPDGEANRRSLRRQLLEKLAVFRASRRSSGTQPGLPLAPRSGPPRSPTPGRFPSGSVDSPPLDPRGTATGPARPETREAQGSLSSPPGSRSGDPPATRPSTHLPPAARVPGSPGAPPSGNAGRLPSDRPTGDVQPRHSPVGTPRGSGGTTGPDRPGVPSRNVGDMLTRMGEPTRFRAVVIGASTGGPAALAHLLPQIAPHSPVPLFVVTHLLPGFSEFLADSLARRCPGAQVLEAREGQVAGPRQVFLAPSGRHLGLRLAGDRLLTVLEDTPPELGFRPAVDVLFRSAAQVLRDRTLAVVLTGMDRDGTLGALAIRAAGGFVMAQDEASSVVWGMPGSVVAAGAADEVVPLAHIGRTLRRQLGVPTPPSPAAGTR